MGKRILCNIIFVALMIPITLGSLVFTIVAYFPFVAVKAVYLALRGKVNVRKNTPEGNETAPSGPVPF